MKQFIFISILFFLHSSSGFSQKAVDELKQKVITLEILNQTLEKELTDLKSEIKDGREKTNEEISLSLARLEKSLEAERAIIEYQKNSVNWWLGVLGLLITFVGIGLPLLGFFVGKELYQDVREQKQNVIALAKETKENVTELTTETKEKVKVLEDEANQIIARLRKHLKQGEESVAEILKKQKLIDELFQKGKDPNLTDEQKDQLVKEAKEIARETNTTDYQKDQAKAIELYVSKKYKDSAKLFEEILRKHGKEIPNSSNIYFYLGLNYAELEEYAKAISFFDKVLELKKDNASAWYNRGVAYGRMKEPNMAIESYKRAVEFNPNHVASWINLGYQCGEKGETKQEIEYYEKAISIDPNNAMALTNLAVTHRKNQDSAKALIYAKRGTKADPTYLSAWRELGFLYNIQGEFDKAISAYEKALAIKPDGNDDRLNIVEFSIFANRINEAKAMLALAKQSQDDFQTNFLEKVIEIIDGSGVIQRIADLALELSKLEGFETWSFIEMENWLKSRTSSFLTIDQKNKIFTLIDQLKSVKKESKN